MRQWTFLTGIFLTKKFDFSDLLFHNVPTNSFSTPEQHSSVQKSDISANISRSQSSKCSDEVSGISDFKGIRKLTTDRKTEKNRNPQPDFDLDEGANLLMN